MTHWARDDGLGPDVLAAVNKYGDAQSRMLSEMLSVLKDIARNRDAFASVQVDKGPIMATNSITGPNVPTTLTFALNGTLYPGDTFAEPTVLVSPAAAGTLVMNASQTSASGTPPSASPIPAGYTGTFTTKGVFTAAAGFTGEVTLSAEVMGVDDQDLDFTVTGPIQPETATFDPTSFVVS